MKFRSSIVAIALAVAGTKSAEGFSASSIVRQHASTSAQSGLPMVATNAVVEGEVKPRKTREVSYRIE
jgi:hypothetical protein